ncbi:UvrD-helicase domain-containing protein [Lautropia mirabilis]|uniref:UvrD-helicase domain-containing protein n=1 Tax=Lautropia mirabilis TaxID=47671 RepID=UPI00288B2A92|nr:UvrD-helicase domain-containing protein [Lautropia mirabilis]
MSNRSAKPDTQADIEVRSCLSEMPPRSFIMTAGAGSGKTTSLIKGITSSIKIHGEKLKNQRKKIACITYTEIAAKEIWADVDNNPLVHISTIHSFLWTLVKPFQADIKAWVKERITEIETEIQKKQKNYGPRTKNQTKISDNKYLEHLRKQSIDVTSIKSFRYGTGSDYGQGVLGHDDILKIGCYLIMNRRLFRILVAQQFPIIFVDESQDTAPNIVEALKAIEQQPDTTVCLGFFGDPMQKIYANGIGSITASDKWTAVSKPENFRCSAKVLRLANAIRRDGDGLQQIAGKRQSLSAPTEGSAHLFIFSSCINKEACLAQTRKWMAEKTKDELWLPSKNDHERVKILVIVHQMAAKRLGFGELYSALNSKAPTAFKDGFLDGTAWPISPCINFLIPLSIAHRKGRQFEVMRLLRKYSSLLGRKNLETSKVASVLTTLGQLVSTITHAINGESNETVGDILRMAYHKGGVLFDSRLRPYLLSESAPISYCSQNNPNTQQNDEAEKEVASMKAFLECPAKQLLSYYDYISEHSPFRTQQGIKGAEFERVLVLLDDDDGRHVQFSYEKYFGIKDLSDTDLDNHSNGKETTIERTRRLFYVSCTRALRDLAVVFFTNDAELARQKILELDLFEEEAIHILPGTPELI